MRRIVEEVTGVEPWANADPDLAVCRGAAFLAAMEDGRVNFKKELLIEEVTSHALGVRAADGKFSILIPANRAAPAKGTGKYTVHSSEFEVVVYQGNGKKVTEPTVLELKPIKISGVQLDASGSADIVIEFQVDEQQLLSVKIEAPGVSEQRQLKF
jgi:molecular chaperone DnaK (HSP70)